MFLAVDNASQLVNSTESLLGDLEWRVLPIVPGLGFLLGSSFLVGALCVGSSGIHGEGGEGGRKKIAFALALRGLGVGGQTSLKDRVRTTRATFGKERVRKGALRFSTAWPRCSTAWPRACNVVL